jgi:hypothetical protein
MAVTTVDRTERTFLWQMTLIVGGVGVLAGGIVLEIVLLSYHSTSKVVKTGGTTTTTTGPAAPAANLITACVAVGVLLILAAAFFSRISKVVLPGGYELDLENGAKIAGAIAAKTNDAATAEQLYKQVVPRAAAVAAVPARPIRAGSSLRSAWNSTQLAPATIDDFVAEAQNELSPAPSARS